MAELAAEDFCENTILRLGWTLAREEPSYTQDRT